VKILKIRTCRISLCPKRFCKSKPSFQVYRGGCKKGDFPWISLSVFAKFSIGCTEVTLHQNNYKNHKTNILQNIDNFCSSRIITSTPSVLKNEPSQPQVPKKCRENL
jgi:hypothetical protein